MARFGLNKPLLPEPHSLRVETSSRKRAAAELPGPAALPEDSMTPSKRLKNALDESSRSRVVREKPLREVKASSAANPSPKAKVMLHAKV